MYAGWVVGNGIFFVSQLYLASFMSLGGKEEGEAMYAREGLRYVNIIKLEVRRLIRCVEPPTASRSQEKVGDKRQRPLLHTPIRPRAYLALISTIHIPVYFWRQPFK